MKVPSQNLQDLPDEVPGHPRPWNSVGCGNGHFDIYDKNLVRFAHIYCWDLVEQDLLAKKLY